MERKKRSDIPRDTLDGHDEEGGDVVRGVLQPTACWKRERVRKRERERERRWGERREREGEREGSVTGFSSWIQRIFGFVKRVCGAPPVNDVSPLSLSLSLLCVSLRLPGRRSSYYSIVCTASSLGRYSQRCHRFPATEEEPTQVQCEERKRKRKRKRMMTMETVAAMEEATKWERHTHLEREKREKKKEREEEEESNKEREQTERSSAVCAAVVRDSRAMCLLSTFSFSLFLLFLSRLLFSLSLCFRLVIPSAGVSVKVRVNISAFWVCFHFFSEIQHGESYLDEQIQMTSWIPVELRHNFLLRWKIRKE